MARIPNKVAQCLKILRKSKGQCNFDGCIDEIRDFSNDWRIPIEELGTSEEELASLRDKWCGIYAVRTLEFLRRGPGRYPSRPEMVNMPGVFLNSVEDRKYAYELLVAYMRRYSQDGKFSLAEIEVGDEELQKLKASWST